MMIQGDPSMWLVHSPGSTTGVDAAARLPWTRLAWGHRYGTGRSKEGWRGSVVDGVWQVGEVLSLDSRFVIFETRAAATY